MSRRSPSVENRLCWEDDLKALLAANTRRLIPLNSDTDQYIDQLLYSQITNEDQGNHKINQTKQSARQLIKEEIKTFEKYIEDTIEENPYGIKRLPTANRLNRTVSSPKSRKRE
ncbi:hypothetical protein TSAR_003672 [Trichomalopsis sarcophagae]|uniref:Uncharacterized protein n=1 Tax=Trichomalopsis sarcophagae TaxID=543379 RepID=A0A232EU62_9HYME|nr:hypothetical protein TSAR_003672 [Trichomalopsis sarcophagae]